tara:strand:- start:20299 stop:21300 length:1002 start_codon:yes stop_codon:yes gene_type:complete
MAINPNTNPTMAGRITAPDANHPYGSSKDETGAGAGDGTPYFKARADDILGAQQALLSASSIVPSGNADNVSESQYMQCIMEQAAGRAQNYDEGGTSGIDAYVVDLQANQQARAGLFDRLELSFPTALTSTGAATVDLSLILGETIGTTIKNIKLSGGIDPAAGDIDGRVSLVYDLVNDWFELLSNPQSYAKITDTKAPTVAGGAFTAGAWQTRTLNTKDNDESLIVTLAADQLTLQAGRYIVKTSAPAYQVNGHKLRLRNITDAVTEIVGSSAYCSAPGNQSTHSFLSGEIVISSPKVFELQHYCGTSGGFGVDLSGGGENAVYATIEIWRL